MPNWVNKTCGICGTESGSDLVQVICSECGRVGCGNCVMQPPSPALPVCHKCMSAKISQALAGGIR